MAAQWVEQLTSIQEVAGSNPPGEATKKKKKKAGVQFFLKANTQHC